MSDRRNLAAFTAPGGSYPEYLSVNMVDGVVEISVRAQSEIGPGGTPEYPLGFFLPGQTASMRMSTEQFAKVLMQLVKAFRV